MSSFLRRRMEFFVLVLWLSFLVLPSALSATLVVRLDLEDLTRDADLIVEARATEAHSAWLGGELFTLVTVQVSNVLKGETGDQLIVVLPGGTDTTRDVPVASIWAGQPELSLDRDYLLFLHPIDLDRTYHTLVGFSQGRFEIGRDAQGLTLAIQDLRGVSRRGADGDTPGTLAAQPLAELEHSIQSWVAADQGGVR